MSAGSLSSFFGLGKQTAQDTAATKIYKTLAIQSGMQPEFDVTETRLEHPGGTGARNTAKKSASARTGYLVPFKSTFILRPNFLPMALIGAGFSCSTVNNSGYYTHTLTWAGSSAVPWVSAFWHVEASDNAFTTRATNARVTKLSLNATPKEIQCDLEGKGMVGGEATGSETVTTEAAIEILPTLGTVSVLSSGVAIATAFRSANTEITQELTEDDTALWQPTRADLPQKSIGAKVTFGGIDITRDFYRELVNGGTSNTSPSLLTLRGDLLYKWESAEMITGAVPYSVSIDMNSVEYTADSNTFQASGDDQIRCGLVADVIDDVATPLSIVVVNNVSAYTA